MKQQAVPIEKKRERKYYIISVIPAFGTINRLTFLLVRKGSLKRNAGCQNV